MLSCSVMSDCNPMDCSLPGSSVGGFLRQEYWSGVPCPSPGDLPNPGVEPASLVSPELADGFFITSCTPEAYEECGRVTNVRLGGWGFIFEAIGELLKVL